MIGHSGRCLEEPVSMFTGTVDFYRRYRPGIPDAVADVLDQAARPGRPRRLLDIGTGPSLVVQALLGRFSDIIAIDTDADMLAAADAALRPALPHDTTLDLVETSAEQFATPPGWQADLVTICRTFHWLDQPARMLCGRWKVTKTRPQLRAVQDIHYIAPLYSSSEAARFLRVPPQTFRNWATGYVVKRLDAARL